MRVSNGELRQRAADMGVLVTFWDWQGHEVTVPDETLAAIVAALESAPPGAVAGPVPGPAADWHDRTAVAPVPERRAWGFAVQLYSLRSRASWGHGDLRDLADLAAWSARDLGAEFVLTNPLHAAEPLPPVSPSPYLPMSRRWVSPLYMRIEDIPEYSSLNTSERARVTALGAPFARPAGRPPCSTGTRSGQPSAPRSR